MTSKLDLKALAQKHLEDAVTVGTLYLLNGDSRELKAS